MPLRFALAALVFLAAPAAAQPNLTVAFDPGETDAQAAAAASFDVGVTVCNTGSGTVDDPRIGYYLSTDAVFDAGDAFVGVDTAQDLDGGDCDDEPDNLIVPGTQPPGAYQLLAVVDDQGTVDETNEGDNTAARPFTVTEGTGIGPDIRVLSRTTPFRLRRGASYSIECTAVNQGEAEGDVLMEVYFSEDAVLSSDDEFLADEGPEELNPGDDEEFEVEGVLIPTVPYGDYYLLCVARVPGDVDLSNNVGSYPIELAYIEGSVAASVPYGTTEVGAPVTMDITIANSAASSTTLNARPRIFGLSNQFSSPADNQQLALAPGESFTFPVTFEAMWPGEWDDLILYNSDETVGQLRTELSGVAVHAGDAASVPTPTAFDVTVPPSASVTETLTIENPGTTPLTFDLYGSDDEIPCIGGVFECGLDRRGEGGPNDFGYFWKDSDEPDGPAFDWVEIRDTGTPVTVIAQEVLLPFDFPFYGVEYDRVYVHHHGHVGFEDQSSVACSGQCSIPDDSVPNNVLMAYYGGFFASNDDDLPGQMHTQDMGDGRFVVQYTNLGHTGGQGKTFQVILHDDGRIVYQYLSMPFDSPSGDQRPARIGIEDVEAEDALRVADWANYRDYMHDELAVAITPTLSIVGGFEPASGTVPAGGSLDVAVTFRSSLLPDDEVYSDSLLIRSNAVEGYERWVPVTMQVGGSVAGEGGAPAVLALAAPFPNPTRRTATLRYTLPTAQAARLTLYDMLGRAVRVVGDGQQAAGVHEHTVDTASLAPGVYLVRLATADEQRTHRLTVAR